ncbi:hypothetical protein EYF80_012027 [Liparis tanakae]|uniref:Uncharacterized protein n=1 Tax=Liparis tanakae TaxID=230148 RepID=A0A4Z2II91_9TELE|nr:hypothetical protein EYF80_012027 [Liparis tanakae]
MEFNCFDVMTLDIERRRETERKETMPLFPVPLEYNPSSTVSNYFHRRLAMLFSPLYSDVSI